MLHKTKSWLKVFYTMSFYEKSVESAAKLNYPFWGTSILADHFERAKNERVEESRVSH
jgi:hypothetical protein